MPEQQTGRLSVGHGSQLGHDLFCFGCALGNDLAAKLIRTESNAEQLVISGTTDGNRRKQRIQLGEVVCLVLIRPPPSWHEETLGRIDLEAAGRELLCSRMVTNAYSSNVIGGDPIVEKEEI